MKGERDLYGSDMPCVREWGVNWNQWRWKGWTIENFMLVAQGNYGTQLPGLFQGGGIANTSYKYQLLICDVPFYSGFFISGYTSNCFKHCDHWCNDPGSPYFRSASTSSSYAGVAFNSNGHRPLSSRLISVGLRWLWLLRPHVYC